MTDITEIIVIILRLFEAVALTFIIPWIKSKISQDKLDKAMKYVKFAVQAAEMIYSDFGSGTRKKEYVDNYIKAHFEAAGLTYDDVTIDNMIESAVLELNLSITE